MVKSHTSSVFFLAERKSPNFPKFFERKLCKLGFKRKKKEFANFKLMMTSYITKIGEKKKLPF
jgi:hypothetical protein